MKPTFSPSFGPAGLGGGGGGASTGGGSTTAFTGPTLTSGLGSGGGAVMMTIFSSTGGGLGFSTTGAGANLAATSGCSLNSSSSRNSALILSSELDGTLAAAMPSALALARITLFSRPSFFEMSYIRTGIKSFYCNQPLPSCKHSFPTVAHNIKGRRQK